MHTLTCITQTLFFTFNYLEYKTACLKRSDDLIFVTFTLEQYDVKSFILHIHEVEEGG